MARDKARHKRYEFLFDKTADADEIAHVLSVVRPGYSLADYVRDLVRMDMGQGGREAGQAAPVVHIENHVDMQPFADALADMMQRPAQTQAPSQREVHSGGIDMTRERPRKARVADSPNRERGPDTQH